MLRVSAMAFITTVLLVAGNGRSEEEDMAAKSPEASLWCVSNCGTCPSVCSPPLPPPPKTSINVLPLPPEKKSPPSPPPPPPPSSPWTFSSSPYSSSGGGQERGGFSYPYYYFYSSDALRARGLLPDFVRLVPLLLVLLSIV